MARPLNIGPADFDDPQLTAFLQAHLDDIAPTAPMESQHALDLDGLKAPGVRVWVAYLDETIVGTVALSELDDQHDELKSMRTAPQRRGQGIATQLLLHALEQSRSRGATRVSLETGSMDFFAAARTLYVKHGFVECEPFGSYLPDDNSVFLTRELEPTS